MQPEPRPRIAVEQDRERTKGPAQARARYGAVPRYYFHVCNGNGFTEDEEGSEHPSLEAARKTAIKGLRGLMSGEMQRGELNLGSFIEIENEARQLVMTVPFEEAVNVTSVKGERPKPG